MGWNTTIVVMNDALDQIRQDPFFGANLVEAVMKQFGREYGKRADIASGNHANAAHVVEQHHADHTAIITVGGNLGISHLQSWGWKHHEVETQVHLCRAWAERLGYRLSKMPAKPGRAL